MTEKNSGPEEAIKGVVEGVKGKAKEVLGTVIGRDDVQREGKAQQDKAQAQRAAAGKEAEAEKARAEATVATRKCFMRDFTCPNCGQHLAFENSRCLSCGSALGSPSTPGHCWSSPVVKTAGMTEPWMPQVTVCAPICMLPNVTGSSRPMAVRETVSCVRRAD